MHWHCEDNGHIWASYLSEDLYDEMFRHCEDNTYIIVIVLFGIGVYHLRGRHCCSFSDFDHRLQEQPYLYATLLYIVDWLLQWSKDDSDTTVFGWPTLWMSNGTFYSTLTFEAVRCYLYVESWFGDGTLCSDYVLYPEEGCTDTLRESLRSWEASQQAD